MTGIRGRRVWRLIQQSILLLSVGCATPALAVEISFRYAESLANDARLQLGMELAADAWERYLLDPVQVVIDVRGGSIFELGFAAGLTFTTPEVIAYEQLREALAADASTFDDLIAVNHLPAGPNLAFWMNEPDGRVTLNQEQLGINGYLDVPRANAKALSLPVSGDETTADPEIVWNEFALNSLFDFDAADGIDGTDFVSAAIHEIGHAGCDRRCELYLAAIGRAVGPKSKRGMGNGG